MPEKVLYKDSTKTHTLAIARADARYSSISDTVSVKGTKNIRISVDITHRHTQQVKIVSSIVESTSIAITCSTNYSCC